MTVAAIDIGTNSTRLLVGDERRTVITRLGRGVDTSGRLDDAAVARTLDVLRHGGVTEYDGYGALTGGPELGCANGAGAGAAGGW